MAVEEFLGKGAVGLGAGAGGVVRAVRTGPWQWAQHRLPRGSPGMLTSLVAFHHTSDRAPEPDRPVGAVQEGL